MQTWKSWNPHRCNCCGNVAVETVTFDGFSTGQFVCDTNGCENENMEVEAEDFDLIHQ